MKIEVLTDTRDGAVLRVQLPKDKLTPWGRSDKLPPLAVEERDVPGEEYERLKSIARSQGGDGFVDGETLARQQSLKGLSDEELAQEYARRKLGEVTHS